MISRRNPATCPHCGQTFTYSCGHVTRLAKLSKAEHDAELAQLARVVEVGRFRAWLQENHPARALFIIGRHARSQGRRLTF